MNHKAITRVHHFKSFSNKKKLFEMMADVLSRGEAPSFQRVLESLIAREKIGSTCIGNGVAIPHCKLNVDSPKATLFILDEGIKFAADCKPDVDILFGVLIPADNCEQHLHLLSNIAKLCEKVSWLEGLRELEAEQDIINYISESDSGLGDIL